MRHIRWWLILFCLIWLGGSQLTASSLFSGTNWQHSGAGGSSISNTYSLQGSAGEGTAGKLSSPHYQLDAGFWAFEQRPAGIEPTELADHDQDGLPTALEDRNQNGNPDDDDSDADGIPDYLDDDDDNDGVLNRDEDPNGNGDPRDDDTDGDGIADYLDREDNTPQLAHSLKLYVPLVVRG